MRVHDFPVFVFCSHAVLRGPVCLKKIKDFELCVLAPATKDRIEEEGIWEIPVAEVRPSALKVAVLSRGDRL